MKKSSVPRPLRFISPYLSHAEGSCLVSMGNTTVLCVATIEETAPPHAQEKNQGWVHAEYAMLPRSGKKRTSRSKASTGGRAMEISRLIGRSLRAAVSLPDLAPYSVIVDCDVIRADGGTRTAAINGGLIALAGALKKLHADKKIATWPLKNFIGAVSLGVCGERVVVDMAYADDKEADMDLNLVMTEKGKVVELQATAEGAPVDTADLKSLIEKGRTAIQSIVRKQKSILGRLPSRS